MEINFHLTVPFVERNLEILLSCPVIFETKKLRPMEEQGLAQDGPMNHCTSGAGTQAFCLKICPFPPTWSRKYAQLSWGRLEGRDSFCLVSLSSTTGPTSSGRELWYPVWPWRISPVCSWPHPPTLALLTPVILLGLKKSGHPSLPQVSRLLVSGQLLLISTW